MVMVMAFGQGRTEGERSQPKQEGYAREHGCNKAMESMHLNYKWIRIVNETGGL
jgi:hypothetical protein